MSGSGFPVFLVWERTVLFTLGACVGACWPGEGRRSPSDKCWSSLEEKLPLLGFLTSYSFPLSTICPCLSYRANLYSSADSAGSGLAEAGSWPACLPWVCCAHGMCPCLCRKVLCLPCHAELSLPWLMLHWWLQHWYSLGLQECSPSPQQILLNYHFMKKTKILSIFSHPTSTFKSRSLPTPEFCLFALVINLQINLKPISDSVRASR